MPLSFWASAMFASIVCTTKPSPLAALEQHDRKVHRVLLEKLVEQKAWDEAVKLGESAVFVDVLSADVHVAYARALLGKSMNDRALYELDTVLVMQPKDKGAAVVHALMAKAHLAKKDVAEARKRRDLALSLDKDCADALELKL